MVEWPSSETERTFNQSAATGRNEPKPSDAAARSNGRDKRRADILRCNDSSYRLSRQVD